MDEFEQHHDFDNYRNRIGDLVLLPEGTNQSYNDKQYLEKMPHYLKENLPAKSLHPKTYENNPNFVNAAQRLGLAFKAHDQFKKVISTPVARSFTSQSVRNSGLQ